MKYKRLAVFIENKKGKFYQVWLKQNEMDMVANLISQIHEGTIKVNREEFPLQIIEPKKNELPNNKTKRRGRSAS